MAKDKDNSGALFVNDNKEKESQPDYSGPCMVNGKKMRIAAWQNTSDGGKTYLGLSFSDPATPKKADNNHIPF